MRRDIRLKRLKKQAEKIYPLYPIKFDIDRLIEKEEGEIFKPLELELFLGNDNPEGKPVYYTPTYMVSNQGRVFDQRSGQLVPIRFSSCGYNYVDMRCVKINDSGDTYITTTGMPLDWLVFNNVEYCPDSNTQGAQIFHKNGDRRDCNYNNLMCKVYGRSIDKICYSSSGWKNKYNPYKKY